MKIFQLMIYRNEFSDLDSDEVQNLARSPNPVFLSQEGAIRFALEDVKERRAEMGETGVFLPALTSIEGAEAQGYPNATDGTLMFYDHETGIA